MSRLTSGETHTYFARLQFSMPSPEIIKYSSTNGLRHSKTLQTLLQFWVNEQYTVTICTNRYKFFVKQNTLITEDIFYKYRANINSEKKTQNGS